jgi:hypothetical protein
VRHGVGRWEGIGRNTAQELSRKGWSESVLGFGGVMRGDARRNLILEKCGMSRFPINSFPISPDQRTNIFARRMH